MDSTTDAKATTPCKWLTAKKLTAQRGFMAAKNPGLLENRFEPQCPNSSKPDNHDRAENLTYDGGSLLLNGKEADKYQTGDRHHIWSGGIGGQKGKSSTFTVVVGAEQEDNVL